MPRFLLRAACAIGTLLLGVIAGAPAQATPFVDIYAMWEASPDLRRPLPDGVAYSCYGDASGSGLSGCSDTLSLSMSVDAPTSITVTASGGLRVTNITGGALTGYADFRLTESAFNPGGPAVGIGIDNPLTQAARFTSAVSGMRVGDNHRCSIGFLGASGAVLSPTTCGVDAPDSSLVDAWIDLSTLAPGASADIHYSLTITYDLVFADRRLAGVPAPASALLLLAGLVGLARLRRRPELHTP